MDIDKKLDFISKLKLNQTFLSNEEFHMLNEIANDLRVLEAIKINSKVPDLTSTPEGLLMVVESTLYKMDTSGDFDRVLNYFMKFYKEKLNI